MSKKISLLVGQRNRIIDYKNIFPIAISQRHYEYIVQNKKLHKKSEASLYAEYLMIQHLFNFLVQKNISSLSEFNYTKLQELFAYLKILKTKYNKTLSISSQRLVYTFFKSFSKWLYAYHPNEAPPLEIFYKSPYKRINETLKTSFFSDYVLKQIKQGLTHEEDIYIKTYILILLYYGFRSMDIILLKEDCLVPSDKEGKYDLHYIDHKQKEEVLLPAIATPVSRAILSFIKHTEEYRQTISTKSIFIEKKPSGKLKPLGSYQVNRLNKFVKKHQIKNKSGELAKITSHMFRRTLATNLHSHGSSLDATQILLNHKNKRTTLKHYIKTKNEDYIEQISNTLNHMQIITKDNMNHIVAAPESMTDMMLRLPDGYCTDELMLTDKSYMCEIFKKRGNCYGCTKMVTTPEFLPYFKNLAQDKAKEIEIKSLYDSQIIKHIEFEKDLIKALINKLEKLENIS